MQEEQKEQFIHCSPSACRCSAVSRRAGPQLHVIVTLEDECSYFFHTPTFFFPLLSMMSYGMRYPFLPVWVSSLGCVPSRLLLSFPFLLASWAVWETEKSLVLCKCCSATAKTAMCYQCYSGHKSKIHHHMSYYEKNYSSQNQYSWLSGENFLTE